ncbi:hypothetical protein [Pseudomonas protegens]|uniref:hypothetical protein n=1 Tax=Pseudomonas protegens TaxID=380021 RepID=UPI001A914094|nr:hypothetical protein [Pseudomonas protegens]BCT33875.1 hypothetical protein PproGo58_33700 [Pseudomonas protegens]
MSVAALIIVLFIKAWRGYAPGEIAGFNEETAEGLIQGGFAEEYAGAEGRSPSASGKSSTRAKAPTKSKPQTKDKLEGAPDSPATGAESGTEGAGGADNAGDADPEKDESADDEKP